MEYTLRNVTRYVPDQLRISDRPRRDQAKICNMGGGRKGAAIKLKDDTGKIFSFKNRQEAAAYIGVEKQTLGPAIRRMRQHKDKRALCGNRIWTLIAEGRIDR